MPYEAIRFPYGGTIDADGHVLEPAWLREEYLEAAHRPRVRPGPERRYMDPIPFGAGDPKQRGFVCPFTHNRKPHGHPDHDERFVAAFSPATRGKLLGENVRRLYGI